MLQCFQQENAIVIANSIMMYIQIMFYKNIENFLVIDKQIKVIIT